MSETTGADERDLGRVAKIAVIGGGAMGRGCAQVFAAAGYPVALQSRKEETLAKAMQSDTP